MTEDRRLVGAISRKQSASVEGRTWRSTRPSTVGLVIHCLHTFTAQCSMTGLRQARIVRMH